VTVNEEEDFFFSAYRVWSYVPFIWIY